MQSTSLTGGQEGHSAWMHHVLHLVDPLLFATFVLEPDLNHSHGQPSVLGQLLPHQSCRFGVLVEAGLEHLELLSLDGGPRTTSLSILSFFLI